MTSKIVSLACAAFLLSACGSDPERPTPTVDAPPPPLKTAEAPGGSVFDWFGGSGGTAAKDERKGVAVNAYLWRASLETFSFIPMDQTDPFGGTIKTGWFVPPATPNERFRFAIFILDSRLRADALRVSVFKEAKNTSGNWVDATVNPEMVTKFENLILNKARKMKIESGD